MWLYWQIKNNKSLDLRLVNQKELNILKTVFNAVPGRKH